MSAKPKAKGTAKTAKRSEKQAVVKAKTAAGWTVANDSGRKLKERTAALLGLARSLCQDATAMRGVLKMISDTATPVALRLVALQVVQAASFSSVAFNPYRPAYLTALRAASADPDPELRQRVLGMLAREQDGKTQQQLLAGLKNPSQALVPAEKALQLLSYDIHSDAYPAAREIVKNPPNDAAKREALRLLAADAGSVDLFEKTLRDQKESIEVRQVSASALHTLAPQKLQSNARAIVLDEGESNELRATCLTALTHLSGDEAGDRDEAVYRQVDKLDRDATPESLRQSGRHYLTKHRR